MKSIIKRYPYVVLAAIVGLAMIAGSVAFAYKVNKSSNPDFDTARVLPQSVTPPAAANAVFTAETIKQYDGKNGHKCYVAVKGVVYEIAGKGQWQDGQHLPSNSQAYCGADLTAAISQSPHGESKLQELPKVGTFK